LPGTGWRAGGSLSVPSPPSPSPRPPPPPGAVAPSSAGSTLSNGFRKAGCRATDLRPMTSSALPPVLRDVRNTRSEGRSGCRPRKGRVPLSEACSRVLSQFSLVFYSSLFRLHFISQPSFLAILPLLPLLHLRLPHSMCTALIYGPVGRSPLSYASKVRSASQRAVHSPIPLNTPSPWLSYATLCAAEGFCWYFVSHVSESTVSSTHFSSLYCPFSSSLRKCCTALIYCPAGGRSLWGAAVVTGRVTRALAPWFPSSAGIPAGAAYIPRLGFPHMGTPPATC
jgi:hypothetical protein